MSDDLHLSKDKRDDLEQMLVNVAQLLDGWHVDVAWTEWDESVRRHVSRWLGYVAGDQHE